MVAGICQQIDRIGQIDRKGGPNGRKVSVGQAIQVMVLNGLGFVNRPLYLTPDVGITQTFVQEASHALRVMRIVARFALVDTRAFHLERAYVGQDDGGEGVPLAQSKAGWRVPAFKCQRSFHKTWIFQ